MLKPSCAKPALESFFAFFNLFAVLINEPKVIPLLELPNALPIYVYGPSLAQNKSDKTPPVPNKLVDPPPDKELGEGVLS